MEERRREAGGGGGGGGWGDDRCGIENEDPPDEWWEIILAKGPTTKLYSHGATLCVPRIVQALALANHHRALPLTGSRLEELYCPTNACCHDPPSMLRGEKVTRSPRDNPLVNSRLRKSAGQPF